MGRGDLKEGHGRSWRTEEGERCQEAGGVRRGPYA